MRRNGSMLPLSRSPKTKAMRKRLVLAGKLRSTFVLSIMVLCIYLLLIEYRFWTTIPRSEISAQRALAMLHDQDVRPLYRDADVTPSLALQYISTTHRPTRSHGVKWKTNQREEWCEPRDVIYNWNPLWVDEGTIPPAPFDASDPPTWWTQQELAAVHGRYLIIIAAGDNSSHAVPEDPWAQADGVDLAVIYFGSDKAIAARYKESATYFLQSTGIKWQVYRKFLPSIDWSQYEYIWMPDDDVRMSSESVVRMFRIAAAHDIRLGQPALHPENIHYAHLRAKPGKALHYVNFVEIMAPFLRVDAFAYILPTIMSKHTNVGWGLDWLWVHLLRWPPMAAIDATPARHVGSQNTMRKGGIYETFKISPYKEFDMTLRMFGCQPFNKRDLGFDVDILQVDEVVAAYEEKMKTLQRNAAPLL
ncbi:Hypothetical Protein FCC1311_000902 [Hondaea fermentalgiana]|uniref:Uncharacterized protein n=1 Tax=Hondaea fermentalgiana TaxID=2315210 RepID=A0A2R5FYR3_9STRA|nr:Hypothetical Protein FCC1311_000902 [Hondaea fermentalgiana]|eukprot:GBG23870.1 Hypothetical Protein FCC1311_000902 [Hondaea fermentalgiana]